MVKMTMLALVFLPVAMASGAPPSLAHRWSFDTATDSIGGVVCSVRGNAGISGGRLNLPGGNSPAADYGDISGITNTLNSHASLTVEGWVTFSNLVTGSKLYCFGFIQGPSSAATFPPQSHTLNAPELFLQDYGDSGAYTTAPNTPAAFATNQQYAVAVAYDADAEIQSLYTNGVLAVSGWMGSATIQGLNQPPPILAVHFGTVIRTWPPIFRSFAFMAARFRTTTLRWMP